MVVRHRVALNNHMRGVLSGYGIVLPQGAKVISRRLPALLKDADNTLPMLARHLLPAHKCHALNPPNQCQRTPYTSCRLDSSSIASKRLC